MNEKDMGTILKELRQQKGLTQKDIANSLIITPQTISKWENGISAPSLEMLVALSEIYGVSIDDLLKGKKSNNDITVVKEEGSKRFNIGVYLVIIMMILLGVASLFFDYALFRITEVEVGLDMHDFVFPPTYQVIEDIPMILAVIIIATPLFIIITSILDRKKYVSLLISNALLIYLLFEIGRYLSLPDFYEPKLGIVLVLIYTLLVIGLITLQIVTSKSSLKSKLLNDKSALAFGVIAYIVAIALPFTYREIQYYNDFINAFTYYETYDQLIVISMMALGSIVLLKSYAEVKRVYVVLSISMIILLMWITIVYIFNSGLIIPSVLIYVYVLGLAQTFRKDEFSFLRKSDLTMNVLTILEIVSVAFYIYILTNNGDLFFNSTSTIYLGDIKYSSLVALHLVLLMLPMFFRFTKTYLLSYGFYTVWAVFEIWFLIMIYQTYISTGYVVTDGMLFFIPPAILGGYGIVNGIFNLKQYFISKEKI